MLLGAAGSVLALPFDPIVIRTVESSNLTDTSATITWLTDSAIPGSGAVVYGTSTANVFNTVNEAAAPAGARGDVHSVTLSNLAVGGTYYYKVTNAGVTDNNGGQYYSFKLGPTLGTPPLTTSVSGTVYQSDGHTPAVGAVVTLKVLDTAGLNGAAGATWSSSLTALVGSSGTWSMTLSPRTADLSSYFIYATNSSVDIAQYTVDGGGFGQMGTQTFSLNADSSNHVTVPAIPLSTSIPTDTAVPAVASVTPTPEPTATSTPLPSPTETPLPPTPTLMVVPSPTPIPTATISFALPTATAAPIVPSTPVPPEVAAVASPTPPVAQPPDSAPPLPPTATPVLAQAPTQPTPPAPPVPAPVTRATPPPPRPRPATAVPVSTLAAPRFPYAAADVTATVAGLAPGAVATPPLVTPSRPFATLTPGEFASPGTSVAPVTADAGGLPTQATILLVIASGLIGLGVVALVFGLTASLGRD
jgi:hypothetical protein